MIIMFLIIFLNYYLFVVEFSSAVELEELAVYIPHSFLHMLKMNMIIKIFIHFM